MVGRSHERDAPDPGLRASRRASVLPAADRPGRGGRGQVSPRRRGDRRPGGSRDGGRRAMPSLRRRAHLVAARRGARRISGLFAQVADSAEPAIARAGEVLKPGGEPVAPDEAFWAIRRVARDPRSAPAARARRRRSPLGRADVHGPAGARDGLGARRAAAALGHGPPRPARRPPGVGRGPTERVLGPPRAAGRRGGRRPPAHLLGHGTAQSARSATRILDVADGNPLFVEEVVAMLADDGVLNGDAVGSRPPS